MCHGACHLSKELSRQSPPTGLFRYVSQSFQNSATSLGWRCKVTPLKQYLSWTTYFRAFQKGGVTLIFFSDKQFPLRHTCGFHLSHSGQHAGQQRRAEDCQEDGGASELF